MSHALESWNSSANFFVDQPIGIGFSYADYDEYASTTEKAVQDIAAFVTISFAHFSTFKDEDSTCRANHAPSEPNQWGTDSLTSSRADIFQFRGRGV
ncbi:hypothetical protein K438DRAFT_1621677 [Mycena galopus ATCC 62051]|nr:hypothetical protein K438DRAFT_1621677 [Mycena galopus ATCC 62051]